MAARLYCASELNELLPPSTECLTVSQVGPVDGGEERMRAQALVSQTLPRSTKQTLQQVHKLSAGFGFLWKLQKTLGAKQAREHQFSYAELGDTRRITN